MLDGREVVAALKQSGVTHVVWIPDSELGTWERALLAEPSIRLIRVCREGEAIAVAGGLLLGGAHPLVVIQCTGLFEAGDALRNLVHDLKLPLFFVIGVRSLLAYRRGPTADSCPSFTQPILHAWNLPYTFVEDSQGAGALAAAYRKARAEGQAAAVLLPE